MTTLKPNDYRCMSRFRETCAPEHSFVAFFFLIWENIFEYPAPTLPLQYYKSK